MEIFLGIQLLALGIFAGLLGGILGLGGGVVFVLILPSIFTHLGVEPNEIVAYSIGNSLFATLFTSLSGNLKQIADKNFYLRPVLIISLPGVFMAYFLLHYFVHSLHYSKSVFNIVFLLVLVALLYRMNSRRLSKKSGNEPDGPHSEQAKGYLLTGLGAGAISALTGLGGGVFIVPVLNSIIRIPMKKANSISLGVISITAFFSSIITMSESPIHMVHSFQLGYLVFPVALFLAGGGMVGSYFGVIIARRLSENVISVLFMVFLVFVFFLKIREFF